MDKEKKINNKETQQLNIADIRRRFRNITIDSPERFTGQYHRHRFSIIEIEKKQGKAYYDITVEAPNGCYAVETWEYLDNIDEAIIFGVKGACL